VGLYTAFILRADIRNATEFMLYRQAERLAAPIADAPTPADRTRVIEDVSRFADLNVVGVAPDSVLLASPLTSLPEDGPPMTLPEIREVLEGAPRAMRSKTINGRRSVYAAVRAPGSDLVVRVAQSEPILFELIRRLEGTLLLGMLMALILSILGSWIAAHQVTRPLHAIRDSARSISEG